MSPPQSALIVKVEQREESICSFSISMHKAKENSSVIRVWRTDCQSFDNFCMSHFFREQTSMNFKAHYGMYGEELSFEVWHFHLMQHNENARQHSRSATQKNNKELVQQTNPTTQKCTKMKYSKTHYLIHFKVLFLSIFLRLFHLLMDGTLS